MVERESLSNHSMSASTEARRESLCNNTTSVADQSVVQLWERNEDIQLTQPHVDLIDNWSSDGDSVSSSSSCSACDVLPGIREGHSSTSDDMHQRVVPRSGVNLLKRARIFTTEEAIDQAIDRWQAYMRSCSEALGVLRQQLIDAYVPYALEKWNLDRQPSNHVSTIGSTGEGAGASTHQTPHTVRKNKALRNMLRHSVKVANQRHLACVSKFAIVSSRLAKWRKPTASQRCQYRDPTTTTWEKPCGNLCIPLLPVCAAHVVQLKPAPSLESLTDRPVDVVNGCYQSDPNSETKPLSVSPRSPTDGGSARIHSCAPELPPPARSTRSVKPSPSDSLPISPPSSTTPTLQLPQQYLFRPCGGAFGQPCNKPVIAWTPYTRCPRHTFTVPPTEETSPRTDSLTETSDLHALLHEALQSRPAKLEPNGS
ncbi:hypothetical protein CSKR_113401 [Clonorchis sinensis]|uniref:Uncharacterized protein n=1 Tax=Clonorchis sinensis TaxID=79923 RepID=A0A8T1MDB0_CLOSI|nr:hypothetical protein CSKR_113401 [Clonorchis sinensis]